MLDYLFNPQSLVPLIISFRVNRLRFRLRLMFRTSTEKHCQLLQQCQMYCVHVYGQSFPAIQNKIRSEHKAEIFPSLLHVLMFTTRPPSLPSFPLSPPSLLRLLHILTAFHSWAVTRELLCSSWKQTAGSSGWLPSVFAGSAKSCRSLMFG